MKVINTIAAWLFAAALAAAPTQINTAPYQHNMFEGRAPVYSGSFIVMPQQWGAYAIDTTKSTWAVNGGMLSPVTSQGISYQPAALTRCNGDFHQSAQTVAASIGVAKWVISTIPSLGSFGQCQSGIVPAKVQVYTLSSATGLRYRGQAFGVSGGSNSVIIGDTAYIDIGNGTWQELNLALCDNHDCDLGPIVNVLPPYMPQESINGQTYKIIRVDATHYNIVGQTAPTPTRTPSPSPTPTPIPNPYAAYIEGIYKLEISNGCGGGNFCPKSNLTREQAAVWLWKAINGQVTPPPCIGVFKDVPCKPF